ncbi:MAG: TraB/GumN family protein [Oligoflexia bacterium]|nr:TraB/GumN family protein [Oligoflexia bacterium]
MKQVLVFILFFPGVIACSSGPKKGPFFWTAEKEGKTIHILGTIHLGLDFEALQCHQEISDSLAESDLFWLEADINRQRELIQTAMNTLVMNPSGHSFKSLSEESQDFFKAKAGQDSTVTRLSYLGLISYIQNICQIEHGEFLEERLAGFENQFKSVTLDLQVQQLAQTQNISQDYLDEESYMPDLIRSNAEKVSKELVEKSVREYKNNCQPEKLARNLDIQLEAIEDIVSKYTKGASFDVLKIDDRVLKQQGFTEEAVDSYKDQFQLNILRKRNENWLKKLVSAQEQKMFVAGGLAHFTGSDNVLDGLRRSGYSVRRFNSDCQPE